MADRYYRRTAGQKARKMALRRGAGAAVVTTTLSYLGFLSTENEPVLSHVNADDELFEDWAFDSDAGADPDCRFVDGSRVFTSQLCSHFIINRGASSPPRAFDRALACAARFKTQCILSPEVGLSIPAAFLVKATETVMMLAPRVIEGNGSIGVRLVDPSNSFHTRSVRFNRTLTVSFLDGKTRRQETRTLEGADAHCVSLLRVSFSPACWENLD